MTRSLPPRRYLARKDYFTRKEVAEHFRVSRRTVDRRIRDGQLKATKMGRSVRIPREEVEKFGRYLKVA
jgi:excisionase family DNA binding protein